MYREENRPFYPLSVHYKFEPFLRGFKFENIAGRDDIYSADTSEFFLGLGSDFGLYKGEWRAQCGGMFDVSTGAPYDLVAVTRLIEDARANVAELLNPDLTQHGLGPL